MINCKNEMFAYQLQADGMPWVSLGHIPICERDTLSIFLHAGGLLVTYYQQYSYSEFKIMRLSLISKCFA